MLETVQLMCISKLEEVVAVAFPQGIPFFPKAS